MTTRALTHIPSHRLAAVEPTLMRQGAWVDDAGGLGRVMACLVALVKGAWIETVSQIGVVTVGCKSRPLRARGLKRVFFSAAIAGWWSRPLR